jgi:DNA-binding MarR family transcriptional regulator
MFRTGQAVRELMLGAVAGTGVSPDEYAVLGAIGFLDSPSPTELASSLGVPPTTISRYVAGFVDAGLALRVPNPSDRRSYRLELTDEGRAIVKTIAPRIRRLNQELGAHADLETIRTGLVALEEAARAVSRVDV